MIGHGQLVGGIAPEEDFQLPHRRVGEALAQIVGGAGRGDVGPGQAQVKRRAEAALEALLDGGQVGLERSQGLHREGFLLPRLDGGKPGLGHAGGNGEPQRPVVGFGRRGIGVAGEGLCAHAPPEVQFPAGHGPHVIAFGAEADGRIGQVVAHAALRPAGDGDARQAVRSLDAGQRHGLLQPGHARLQLEIAVHRLVDEGLQLWIPEGPDPSLRLKALPAPGAPGVRYGDLENVFRGRRRLHAAPKQRYSGQPDDLSSLKHPVV